MNPPAPVKDVVAKKKDAVKLPAPPKAEEEDLDAVEAGTDGHIVTPVDDGGPGDGWAQAEAAEPVEKPLTKDADELAEFEKWAAGDEGAFDPNQFKDAPPTNDGDHSDDDEPFRGGGRAAARRPGAQGRRLDGARAATRRASSTARRRPRRLRSGWLLPSPSSETTRTARWRCRTLHDSARPSAHILKYRS